MRWCAGLALAVLLPGVAMAGQDVVLTGAASDWMAHTRGAGLEVGLAPSLCQAAADTLTTCE
ncbi:MAG: hypothetical protein JRJ84_12310 [Deltaproteobacteria bacterium]|nr:hypothetical protein [Deltaproteobacteria bacterium]